MIKFPSELKEDVALDSINKLPEEINPRVHDERQIKYLQTLLQTYGQTRPLIVNKTPVKGVENPILAGNGTWDCLKRLGWDTCDIRVFDLDEDHALALAIQDNRAYELGKTDEAALLKSLYELESHGMDMEELGYHHEEVSVLEGNKPETSGEGVEKESIAGEIQFTEELYESHQYVVLYFDNEVTWLTAQDVLNIKPVHAKGSKPGTKFQLVGKGRVVRGDKVIEKLQEAGGLDDDDQA